MSPLDKSGAFHMNPEQARARDAMPPKPITPAPGADSGEGDQTIILTKKADGSITCDSGDGKPMPYDSVDEALDAVKAQLGGGETDLGAGDDMLGAGDSGGDQN